jgi:hypothetical protein
VKVLAGEMEHFVARIADPSVAISIESNVRVLSGGIHGVVLPRMPQF